MRGLHGMGYVLRKADLLRLASNLASYPLKKLRKKVSARDEAERHTHALFLIAGVGCLLCFLWSSHFAAQQLHTLG